MVETIMIGTMIKNTGKWLPEYFKVIKNFSYPKEKLRIVFIYGKSTDNTFEVLKEEKEKNDLNIEVYSEPRDEAIRLGGAQASAAIYKDFQNLFNEDYFMLFDSDIIGAPVDLIEQLMKVQADIVAPYPWSENHRHFYDTWIFRINNVRFSPFEPPVRDYPIEVDSVGTCFLSKGLTFKSTNIENPYPNLTFCNNAKGKGYSVVALPYIEIFHVDLEKYGIFHNPLPPQSGGYPASGWITNEYPVKEWKYKTPDEKIKEQKEEIDNLMTSLGIRKGE